MRALTFLAALLLTVPAAMALPAPGFTPVAVNAPPSQEEVTIQLNLTGVATKTDGGPDDGFTAFLNVTGTGTRYTPQGNGVQIRADGLTATILIVRNADNVTVENFTALVGFHAQSASCAAQGLEAGCFKFNLQVRGKRSEAIIGNENPNERVLSMGANGETVGTPDGGVFAMDARGRATTQPDGTGSGAQHFNIDLAGQGSTGSIQ